MEKAMLIPAVLVAAVIIASGCTTQVYTPIQKMGQEKIDSVSASATAWLSGSDGSDFLPGGLADEPIAVFDANRSFDHWVVPVKDSSGLYIGFMASKYDSFTVPAGGVTKYPDPRHNLFSTSSADAYSLMYRSSNFTSDQIKEPYISVIQGKNYYWTSDVVVGGKLAGTLTYPVSLIDPSNADRKDL